MLQLETSTSMKTLFNIEEPKQWRDFIRRNPEQECEMLRTETLTESLLVSARQVNLSVNAMFYKADEVGRDFWQIALEFGDCEDLMLAKRDRLHTLGYSFGALRPIICQTPGDVYHAVLCLVTDLGDYILDNRYSLLMPWQRLPYHWEYRWAGKTWEILLNG